MNQLKLRHLATEGICMRKRIKVTINLDPEVTKRAKELGINISSIAEEALREQIKLIEGSKMNIERKKQ